MSSDSDQPRKIRYPARPKRGFTLPASEVESFRRPPPTREEYDEIVRKIEERAKQYEHEREIIRQQRERSDPA